MNGDDEFRGADGISPSGGEGPNDPIGVEDGEGSSDAAPDEGEDDSFGKEQGADLFSP